MEVIKKSGKKETFSVDKLANSVAGACRDARENLSDAEIRRLVAEFQQIVHGKELMTTQQIDIVINGLLYSKKYYRTLEKYVSYNK